MATAELYLDVEEVRMQVNIQESNESDSSLEVDSVVLEWDRSHTAAVMDTDKSS